MTLSHGSAAFAGVSRLISERIASTTAPCGITFGTYRNRDTNGTLTLYIEDDQFLTTKLWSNSKENITANWTVQTVSIGRRKDGFRFIFIAEHIGALISSDLSIDDFYFNECAPKTVASCAAFLDPFNCSNNQCIHEDNVSLKQFILNQWNMFVLFFVLFSYAILAMIAEIVQMNESATNMSICVILKIMPHRCVHGHMIPMLTCNGNMYVLIILLMITMDSSLHSNEIIHMASSALFEVTFWKFLFL